MCIRDSCLADWRIANLVTGEYICDKICEIEYKAIREVVKRLDDIREQDAEACERLMYALLLSGLAMQMAGNSRPASSAEHHLSHLWEMEVINPHTEALHGESRVRGEFYVFYRQRNAGVHGKAGSCLLYTSRCV